MKKIDLQKTRLKTAKKRRENEKSWLTKKQRKRRKNKNHKKIKKKAYKTSKILKLEETENSK